METEEFIIVLGLLLILAFLLYPSETISQTFCEGSFGKLDSYDVSVRDGFLRVYYKGEEIFTAKGDQILVKKTNVDYSYSKGCYQVSIKEKPEKALYIFIAGVVLIGAAFYYMAFLKYR
ncbi:hypothetical protein NF865_06900 [Thermococcus aggregans]|uniref:Uncharacterized protein n=1 Tax=Thermococcus aggregans TaxID=110163 RepID=A0A9E7MW84_THEAG|nr:hypothetical protein [Thermococcus aggregans]USS40066.1 hypothetical protein NF865_06900 [Thermococcus aggregans]